MIELIKLKDAKGAERYGCCTQCADNSNGGYNLVRIKFNGVSVTLCPECLKELKVLVREVTP